MAVPMKTDPFDPIEFPEPDLSNVGEERIPGLKYSRVGYVKSYMLALYLPNDRPNDAHPAFFSVTLVDGLPDDSNANANPGEYFLLRNITMNRADDYGDHNYATVTYGNVAQGIVATVKDALLHRKKIAISFREEEKGFRDIADGGPKKEEKVPNRKIIRSVLLFR